MDGTGEFVTGSADRAGRILIVQRSANRDGSAISARMLADGLAREGWEVHVAFAWDGEIVEDFLGQGHHCHVVPHDNWLREVHPLRALRNVLAEVRTAGEFRRRIEHIRPVLVYVNTSASGAAALATRRARLPLVWHLREMTSDVGGELVIPRGWKRWIRWIIRSLPTRLVVNSHAAAEALLGPNPRNVEIVPNAASPVFFEESRDRAAARLALGVPAAGRLVGVPSTLRPSKGHPFFLRAMRSVLSQRPEVKVILAGEGAPDYVRSLQDRLEGDDRERVLFLGSIRDMPAFYRACDVVVVPSVAEAFGRVIVEAFATGTPVVASAVGGILETVTDGETGLLVTYGDEVGLAGAVRRLLDEPELRARLRHSARAEADLRFREAPYQERLVRIVHEVAEGQGRGVKLRPGCGMW